MRRSLFLLVLCILSVPSYFAQQQSAPSKLLIAFASYRDRAKYPDIFFYEHDGADKGKIVASVPNPRQANASGHPSLSHDGRLCAYTFEVENKTGRIFFWDLKDHKFVDLPVINDSPHAQLGPSLSGKGNLVAFQAWNRTGGTQGWQLYLYNLEAKKMLELPNLTMQATDNRMPALSGDGRFLAFTSNRKGGSAPTNLYLYDRMAENVQSLPGLGAAQSDYEPALSGDGNLIAFVSERPAGAGGRDIYLFDRKAEAFLELKGLNTPSHEVSPQLSADGRYLVFVSDRIEGEGERDIYLYDRMAQKLLPTPGLNSPAEDFEPCIIVRP